MRTILYNCILIDEKHPLHQKNVSIHVDTEHIELIEVVDQKPKGSLIDCTGMYVSSGWIDLHVHCYQDNTDLGVEADRIGVDSGVVCIVDAGSSGSNTIDDFYNQVKHKDTIVKAWLNIAKTGLLDRHELKDPQNIDVDATISKMVTYQDFVVGLKVRASGSVMGSDTVTPFQKAHEVSNKTGKPIMVHFGNNPPTIDEVLNQMCENDVLTHCFHGKPNGILVEDTIRPSVLHKRTQGVLYDVGHGQDSFSFSVAKKSLSVGFEPDSISTDLHKYNVDQPVGSLANVMTKFLTLGFSLEKVISLVTSGPAKIAHLNDFGTLNIGKPAHLTFFKVEDIDTELMDSMHVSIKTNRRIVPIACMVNGKYIEVKNELFKK